MPSYPSGQIGFLICSKEECDFSLPVHKFSAKQKEAMNLKVYSEEMHASAFCLPVFVKDVRRKDLKKKFNFFISLSRSFLTVE